MANTTAAHQALRDKYRQRAAVIEQALREKPDAPAHVIAAMTGYSETSVQRVRRKNPAFATIVDNWGRSQPSTKFILDARLDDIKGYVAQGMTLKQMADELHCSVRMVKTTLIRHKVDVGHMVLQAPPREVRAIRVAMNQLCAAVDGLRRCKAQIPSLEKDEAATMLTLLQESNVDELNAWLVTALKEIV